MHLPRPQDDLALLFGGAFGPIDGSVGGPLQPLSLAGVPAGISPAVAPGHYGPVSLPPVCQLALPTLLLLVLLLSLRLLLRLLLLHQAFLPAPTSSNVSHCRVNLCDDGRVLAPVELTGLHEAGPHQATRRHRLCAN